MPDEPEGAVAVAPAPPTLGPEAVPAPELERPPEEVETAEPEGAEEEAPPDALTQAIEEIAELAKEDPEAAARLREKLGIKEEGVEELQARFELEQGRQYRQQTLEGYAAQAAQFSEPNMRQAWGNWTQALARQVNAAAKEIAAGNREDATIMADTQRLTDSIVGYAAQAASNHAAYTQAAMQATVLEALESSPIHPHLSAEDRQSIQLAMNHPNPLEAIYYLIGIYANAGVQAAPTEVRKRAEQDAEKRAKVAERVTSIMEKLPKGRKPQVTPGGTSGISNLGQADDAYLAGRISIEQYRQLRSTFGLTNP